MRNAIGIAFVVAISGACGRTPIDVDASDGASRDSAKVSDSCVDLCEQLACDAELSFAPDSFEACTQTCEDDRRLAASVSGRCARVHEGFAECLVLADCEELDALEQGGVATCRVQTDELARHCPGVAFELAG